jgi:hypothetical protein
LALLVHPPAGWPGLAGGRRILSAACGPGPAAWVAGDEVAGEQEDSGRGDNGEPGGRVEEPLPGVVEVGPRVSGQLV